MSENVINSEKATKKNPTQGKFRSGIQTKRPPVKIDKHGIRRETSPVAPKKTRPKKV